MKIYHTLFLLITFISAGFSQQSAIIKDPKAKSILDDIAKEMQSNQSLEIGFELNIEFPGTTSEIQKGILIQKGEQFFLDMDQQAVYCDGVSLWLHLKNNNEVQLNNAESTNESGFLNPATILNAYNSDDFSYAITNEGTEDGEIIVQIEFKPNDSNSPYSKMRMTILKNQKEIKRMKVFSKDGSMYTLSIINIETNKEYPASTFVFDKSKFPGVHVEDLRI